MWWVGIALAFAAAGCGRVGFDEATARTDAASPDAADSATVDAYACGTGYHSVDGLASLYQVGDAPATWLDAEAACEAGRGHLVIPDDGAEDAYVGSIAQAGVMGKVWIGVSDHLSEGTMLGVTGVTPTPTWNGTEPNNLNNGEDCVEVFSDGTWNDNTCANARDYLCECDGVPAAVPKTYCDTTTVATCGDCSTSCGPSQVCDVFAMCN